ncbi:histone-lysine N-methyltransferase, putative [Plasmodium vivax]|uniref:SET domain containing protein n=6 Tax=Plasmodium vivax TaxID=5855 RepID=A5JZV3_PLAVS|nr:SET domain containing protein [Plasmodium vivax]KMZ78064.1 SET domain-containing protein [Plasmodium vivax India VII]KMZ84404.1 SET domain-containing protein [Plasmodium vivax Brazil I]KMZ90184.1 SET domain-containing protein [Plasmodium vivax Mauritania I]KMZ96894.1 SET domain-containing protein [Plasmodium vivax North Korean]EDL47514.1 SET domain containing protein [Plasmodium vivax]|eukprot:XP_001617241.1 SET domain containing protein [Plasmodium vivax Sal-1]
MPYVRHPPAAKMAKLVMPRRRFHNYFAKNTLRQMLKKEEIAFNELHKRVYVGSSPLEGVGIFSCDEIKKNEIIEICPTVKMKNEDIPEKLVHYLFESKKENMNTKVVQIVTKRREAINYKLFPLGYGILYNHSDSPNAFVHIVSLREEEGKSGEDHKDGKNETITSDQIMIFRAQRDIQKNEEIFISYGHSWWKVSCGRNG